MPQAWSSHVRQAFRASSSSSLPARHRRASHHGGGGDGGEHKREADAAAFDLFGGGGNNKRSVTPTRFASTATATTMNAPALMLVAAKSDLENARRVENDLLCAYCNCFLVHHNYFLVYSMHFTAEKANGQ